MKYATVCSGIGAPEQAWSDLWGPPEFTSEIEPFPSAVLKHHYPDVINHGDMTKYKEWPDHELGLICGGTPCQSFSVAGLRKGMDDPRGNLTLTFLGILARYNPRWFVWENVPGVFSSGLGTDFGTFLLGLAELGYSVAYRVLDAQFFGVPQRRRRIFVVGYLGADWRPPFAVLSEPESLRGNTPKGREPREGIAGGAGDSIKSPSHWDGGPHPPLTQSHNTGGVGGSNQEIFSQRGAYLVMAHGQPNAEIVKDGSPSLTCNHEAPIVCGPKIAHTLRGEGFDASEDGTGRGTPIVFHPRQTPISSDKALPCETGGPAYTIDQTGAQAVSSGSIVRRLTPRECERLQGFPDDYTLIPWKKGMATDGHRYKALGNSMAVPVVRWIGERIQMWEDLKTSGQIKT